MRKLYLFNNGSTFEGCNNCYSMADDGTVLGNHICSHDNYMLHDLHDRKDRLETIKKHFGNEPYEVELIPSNKVESHQGLAEACRLNQLQGEAANQYEKAGVSIEVSE